MNKKYFQKNVYEKGAASIFIVIFFALLVGVITVSFVQIANQDQQQALNNDLSQSAYDSAKAGVADANRVIVYCESQPAGSDRDNCLSKLNNSCEDIHEFKGVADLSLREVGGESNAIKVSTNAQDDDLNQSYTCAKIQYRPETIAITLDDQQMRIIGLKSGNGFSKVKIKWFDNEYVDAGTPMTLPTPIYRTNAKFPDSSAASGWGGITTPPVMRAQIVYGEPDGSLDINNLANNSSAVFLYPNDTQSATTPNALMASPGRTQAKTTQPAKVACNSGNFSSGQLACSVDLLIPSIASGQEAYLILSPIYNKANIEVQALDGADNPVPLEGYPTIDVTGRAGDVYRRVKSTIDLHGIGGTNALPGFDVTKSLCKDFAVTSKEYFSGECSNDN